jgi:O-antigen/teichoic acid export membrane protein
MSSVSETPSAPGLGEDAALAKGKGTFVGSVLTLGVGTVLAQGIKLLSAPVLSRLFGPAATGIAGLFDSVTRTVCPVTTLNYHVAIVLPEKDEEGVNLFALSCLLVVAISLISAGAMWLGGDSLLRLIKAPELIPYEWLFPLGIFAIGMELPLRYWNTRQKYFRRQASSSVWGSLASFAALVALGLAGLRSGEYLILGRMLLLIVPVGILIWVFLRQDVRFALLHCRAGAIWQAAKRWRDFPLYGLWAHLLNGASQQIPALLLVAFFSAEVAGFYGYSVALLALPMSIVTGAVAQVFLQHASAAHAAGGNLAPMVEKAYKSLSAISLMPVLIVALIGPELFQVILGDAWTEAGIYSAILSPWLFLNFVYNPISALYSVLERQGFLLATYVVLFLARLAALVVGGKVLRRPDLTIFAYSAVSIVLAAVQSGSILWFAKASFRSVLVDMFRQLVHAVPTILVVVAAKWALRLPPVWIILVTSLATVPYLVWVYRHDAILRMAVTQSLSKLLRHGK